MIEPLKVPIATAVYTLFGVLLATWWYDGNRWPLWTTLIAAVVLALGLAPVARRWITSRPRIALRVFESYGWINGLLAAVAGCTAVLVTVALTASGGGADPQKELASQVTAALTTLLGGLVVATKDSDETLGSRIAKEFQAKFTVEGQEQTGKVALKPDSPSLLAVFTKYENGWTDWAKDNRTARVDQLTANLAQDRVL